MHEYSNEMKGTGRQIKGKVKEETGDLLGDRSMEIEGKVEKNVGKIQRGMGRSMREVKSSVRDRSTSSSEDLDVMDEEMDEVEELEDIGPSRRR
jgi:uncharacterized protein YjbJ (UPF0337 family)